ncbi:hypothetical protein OIU79_008428 [Salix purpurea]|uniref:Uncharacterized protein n=1 Tax=Salix purpurea TaxID=77065 RepID=A0A9Q0TIE6_SALPP|nr:hypothetical protein OIU79_008428 [Salix purpurea]
MKARRFHANSASRRSPDQGVGMAGNQGGADGGRRGMEEEKGRDSEENNEEECGAEIGFRLRRDGMRFLGFVVEGHFLAGAYVNGCLPLRDLLMKC